MIFPALINKSTLDSSKQILVEKAKKKLSLTPLGSIMNNEWLKRRSTVFKRLLAVAYINFWQKDLRLSKRGSRTGLVINAPAKYAANYSFFCIKYIFL